jgi:hypothetical protein
LLSLLDVEQSPDQITLPIYMVWNVLGKQAGEESEAEGGWMTVHYSSQKVLTKYKIILLSDIYSLC